MRRARAGLCAWRARSLDAGLGAVCNKRHILVYLPNFVDVYDIANAQLVDTFEMANARPLSHDGLTVEITDQGVGKIALLKVRSAGADAGDEATASITDSEEGLDVPDASLDRLTWQELQSGPPSRKDVLSPESSAAKRAALKQRQQAGATLRTTVVISEPRNFQHLQHSGPPVRVQMVDATPDRASNPPLRTALPERPSSSASACVEPEASSSSQVARVSEPVSGPARLRRVPAPLMLGSRRAGHTGWRSGRCVATGTLRRYRKRTHARIIRRQRGVRQHGRWRIAGRGTDEHGRQD